MLIKQNIYEKVWVVFEHGKKVFFFSCFNVFVVWVCVFGKFAKVLTMLVSLSPVIWAFGGCLSLVYLGLEGLGVSVFLVSVGLPLVLFFFGVGALLFFIYLLFLFVLVCSVFCVGMFWLCFFYLFFLVVFFMGLPLFCSLCWLEWSRCCSSFVLGRLFCLCLFFVSLCLFLMKIIVFPAILVFLG